MPYFTLQHSGPDEYLVSFGKVDASLAGDNADKLNQFAFVTGALAGDHRGLTVWASSVHLMAGCTAK